MSLKGYFIFKPLHIFSSIESSTAAIFSTHIAVRKNGVVLTAGAELVSTELCHNTFYLSLKSVPHNLSLSSDPTGLILSFLAHRIPEIPGRKIAAARDNSSPCPCNPNAETLST
jgi:hypothetical protein